MSEEDSCSQCIYCSEDSLDGYEGYCSKIGYFLKTIDDRLCEAFFKEESQ